MPRLSWQPSTRTARNSSAEPEMAARAGRKCRGRRAEAASQPGRAASGGRAPLLPAGSARVCGSRWRRGCTWSTTWTVRAAGAGPRPRLSRPGGHGSAEGRGPAGAEHRPGRLRALPAPWTQPGPGCGVPGLQAMRRGLVRRARRGCSCCGSPDTEAPRLVCPVRKEPGAASAASRERELGCQWFPGIDT